MNLLEIKQFSKHTAHKPLSCEYMVLSSAVVPYLVSRGIIKQVLPLHHSEDLDHLKKSWVQAFFRKQPLGNCNLTVYHSKETKETQHPKFETSVEFRCISCSYS